MNLKKILAVFIVTFHCLTFSCTPSICAPAMYSVDYKLVIALHPQMGNYDMVIGRHLRNDIDFSDYNVKARVNEEIAKLTKAAQKKSDDIMQKMFELENKISQMEESYSQPTDYMPDMKRFAGDNTRKTREKRIEGMKAELKKLNEENIKIWDDVMNPMYYTREQSNRIVTGVLNEIDLILNDISIKRGGALIIDSDYQAIQTAPTKIGSVPAIGGDPLSIRLYQSLISANVIPELPGVYKTDPELAQYASFARKDMEESFDKNISTQISKSPLFSAVPGVRGRLVLVGNTDFDLTLEVVEKIFIKHGIRNDVATRILNLIK